METRKRAVAGPERELLGHHLPALTWAALTAVLLLVPGDAITPRRPGIELLEDPAHGILSLVQAWLAARSLSCWRRPGAAAPIAAAASFGWALLLEGLQILAPGRGWEVTDLVFAAVGAVAGAWLWHRRSRPPGAWRR